MPGAYPGICMRFGSEAQDVGGESCEMCVRVQSHLHMQDA